MSGRRPNRKVASRTKGKSTTQDSNTQNKPQSQNTNENSTQKCLKILWEIFKKQEEYTPDESFSISNSIIVGLTEIEKEIDNLHPILQEEIPISLLIVKEFCNNVGIQNYKDIEPIIDKIVYKQR
ncbi:hypothetical protein M9Y10_033751 [Tritrichomonas musculus]|uniref:Uncharacterized protein n=1 Tax=Tritrichomonas musculus TaxID=1915356 RepID=A0ABR2KD47_9EUKA